MPRGLNTAPVSGQLVLTYLVAVGARKSFPTTVQRLQGRNTRRDFKVDGSELRELCLDSTADVK